MDYIECELMRVFQQEEQYAADCIIDSCEEFYESICMYASRIFFFFVNPVQILTTIVVSIK
jgi:hypothetical protein